MSDHRLASIELDAASLPAASAEIEHERRVAVFDLIEQQRRLYDARTRELVAVAELNKSITQLWLATGTVLENLNIRLDDPKAAQKAIPKAKPVKTSSPRR